MPNFSYSMPVTLDRTPKLPWKTLTLASTITQASTVRGSNTATVYGNEPSVFLRTVVDGAKENMQFLQVAKQQILADGNQNLFMPYRKRYMISGDWETSSEEYTTANTDILYTDITTPESITFTPVNTNYAVATTNQAIRITGIPLIQYLREELMYKYSIGIDSAIRDAVCGTATTGGTPTVPTEMSNTVQGCQTIFGGDATDASNSLNVGHILTTTMIKKMVKCLESKFGYYWSGNAWTKATGSGGEQKNPWTSSPQEPFVLFIGPEQWANLMDDTQFTNAAEWGGNGPVLNGEINRYLGVSIVKTTNLPAFTSADNFKVTSATRTVDVDGHICAMIKAQRAVGLAMGRQLDFKMWDEPARDGVAMKISFAHHAKAVQADAIVRAVVSDE